MRTGQLFNTLSMIWNHTMPDDAKTHRYKRYSFNSFYTPEYFKLAIRNVIHELLNRDDLTNHQEKRLSFMANYFNEKLYEEDCKGVLECN